MRAVRAAVRFPRSVVDEARNVSLFIRCISNSEFDHSRKFCVSIHSMRVFAAALGRHVGRRRCFLCRTRMQAHRHTLREGYRADHAMHADGPEASCRVVEDGHCYFITQDILAIHALSFRLSQHRAGPFQ